MSIKKIFAGVTVTTCAIAMLGGSFAPAFALTIEELEAQIATLQEQLLLYQSQLEDVDGETATPAAYEGIPDGFTFENALYYGMTSDEVKYLQIVLKVEIGDPTYPDSVGATGWFGPISKASVIAFQEKYTEDVLAFWNLTVGTGYVGDTTRAKLNVLLAATTPEPEPTPEPSELGSEADCTDAGYFWYDDACHANAEPASSFENETDCDTAGYFWYDDICNETEEVVEVEGDLTVALSDDTPIAANVPLAAQSVEFLRFDMTADTDNVVVTSIKFTRTEAGSKNDFDNVWLEKNGTIVADGKSVNSSSEVTLTLNETIEGGTTVTYNLMGDLSGTSGNMNAFRIADVDDIVSDAGSVADGFPIAGNAMTLSSYAVGTAAFTAASAATIVDIGDEQVILGEFRIAVASSNNNDFTFKTIRLKETGSANLNDLENIALYDNDGNVLDDEPLIDGNYVGFGDVGYAIEDGDTKRFSVRADIISGDDADTIIFKLNKDYELFVEEDVGFGATASGAASLKTYTFNAGKFALALDDSSPSNAEYAEDTNQVTALIAKMNLGQDVEVDGLAVYLHSDTNMTNGATSTLTGTGGDEAEIEADIEDVRLYVNDTLIDSTDEVVGTDTNDNNTVDNSTSLYFDFTSSFTLSDDDLLEVRFDIKSGADAGNVYRFTIGNANFSSPEYVASGETVSSGDKTGSATGKTITITSGLITATRNDGYATGHLFISGESDAKLFQFVMEAGVSSKVKVQKLDFDIAGVSTTDDDNFGNVKLKVGTTQLGDTTDFSNTYARFESLDYEIAAGNTAVFALYSDITAGWSGTSSIVFTLDVTDSLFYDKEDNEVSLAGDESSASLTVSTGGTLTVSADESPVSEVLTANTDDNVVGSWTITAEDDAIDLTHIYFANDFAEANSASDVTDSNIELLKLYADGAQVGAAKPLTSGTIDFNLGSADAITVPKNGLVEIDVKADLTAIESETLTNKRLELVLYSLTAEGTGGRLTTVEGIVDLVLDGETYDSHANSQAANEFVITKAKPVLATNAGAADAGSKPNGTKKIYAFDVSAPAANPIAFKKVVLTVAGTASSTAIGASNLWDNFIASEVIYRDGTAKDATITSATSTVSIEFDSVQTVGAGGTATFVLEGALSGFNAAVGSNDYIDVNIQNLAESYVAADAYADIDTEQTASFWWTDNSGTYKSLTDDHWMLDYLFSELDLAKVTLEY